MTRITENTIEAFAIAIPHDQAMDAKDEVSFFQPVKVRLVQARQKSNRQMTVRDDIKMVVTHDRQERQHLTGGIFYCRDSAEINGSCSLHALYRADSEVLRIRQQNIPPKR